MTRRALLVLGSLVLPAVASAKYEGAHRDEGIAVAIVFDTQEPVVTALKAALDKVDLEPFDDFNGPFGSKGILIGYDSRAWVVAEPMLNAVSSRALDAIEPHGGNDMIAGVRLAIAELARSTYKRRALIVITDRVPLDPAWAVPARDAGIYLHPIMFEPDLAPALEETMKIVRREPRLLPYEPDPPRREHTEPPWWWYGVACSLAVAALLFVRWPRRATA